MTRQQISSGSRFEAEIGYSRAIVDGDWIWVSGTTEGASPMATCSKPLLCSRSRFFEATMPVPVALNTATEISAGGRAGRVVVGAAMVVELVAGDLDVATRPPSAL